MSSPSGRDRQTARSTPAVGPLGATNTQAALDLIAAAGPFFTTEQTASYVLGTGGGSSTVLKQFAIATGTTRKLFAIVSFTGGTTVTPTSAIIHILATAERQSGGTTTVTAPALMQSSDISALNTTWSVPAPGLVDLRFAASGGPTVRALIQYLWLEQLPP